MFWFSIWCTIVVNLGLLVRVVIEMRRAAVRGNSGMQLRDSISNVEEMTHNIAPPRVKVAAYHDIAV